MAPVTEIAYLPLKTGNNPSDAHSPAGSIWQETLRTVLDQEGAQRAYWSLEVENPSMLRLFIDWDSIDHHKKFMESEYVL
jgi:quinol monooxygenase YgiN